MKRRKNNWGRKITVIAGLAAAATTTHAGDIFLTGHDVTLHAGQGGLDLVALDYLRGADAKATYDIMVVGTAGVGFANFTGGVQIPPLANGAVIPNTGSTLTGYGTVHFYDAATLAADPNRAAILAAHDALVVLSHINCGGCSLTTPGSTALNTMAGDIATAFNAGLDIFAESSANLATYYDFLPPGAVATGLPISGSSGFTATTDGAAIGILPGMINGYPTHNRFVGFDSDFTILEQRLNGAGTADDEVISLGLRGGTIVTDDGIVIGPSVPDGGMTAVMIGFGLLGLEGLRRRFRR